MITVEQINNGDSEKTKNSVDCWQMHYTIDRVLKIIFFMLRLVLFLNFEQKWALRSHKKINVMVKTNASMYYANTL